MEVLLSKLSEKADDSEIRLLTSPKYHCELAGEGFEYVWGLAKRFYRSIENEEKRAKEKFQKMVRASILFVKRQYVINFAAKCRCYMMTYNAYNNNVDPLTYRMIERFVKMWKTHRNIVDRDKAFVEKAWREAVLNLNKN